MCHDAAHDAEPVVAAIKGAHRLVTLHVRREQRGRSAVGTYGATAVITSTTPDACNGVARSPTTARTPLLAAHRTAAGSTSTPITNVSGCARCSNAATAPLPVHRSTAVPAGRSTSVARRASSSVCAAWDVDPGRDAQVDATEAGPADDPRQRLARLTSAHPDLELGVVGTAAQQLVRLVLGRDTSRRGQAGDDVGQAGSGMS